MPKKNTDAILEALADALAQREKPQAKREPTKKVSAPTKKASAEPRKKRELNGAAIEQLLEAARMSLETYGTIVPPREELLPILKKKCPHCGVTKSIVAEEGNDDFGIVMQYGQQRPQAWCRRCRNSKDSHPTRFGMRKN